LVLMGEEWTGKSWAGNNILGRNAFDVKRNTEHVMQDFRVIDGRYVTVVDTPGWDSKCNPDAPLQILQKAYSSALCKEFHILLLIIPICLNQEWNEKFAQRMLDVIGHFNNDMRNHTMLLFTRSSHLQSTGLEGYLKGSGKPIQSLVEKFEHRYHVLNDSTKNNHRKFRELMKKIEQMVQENRG
ncbi:GTPase IMAP family member 4 isoform X3, partial [Silurus meridionalis]